jgi:two-component system OmpR family response regulator
MNSANFASGMRVLVVDDQASTVFALKRVLMALGFDVRTAFDGISALRRAVEFKPDAVLLDLTLPRLDGFAVAERMREMSETRDALLVALSGWSGDAVADRTRESGFDVHLVKPVTAEILLQALAVTR